MVQPRHTFSCCLWLRIWLVLVEAHNPHPRRLITDVYKERISLQRGLAFNVHLTGPEFIKDNGYPAEEHWVTTKDGYILTILRIPYSPKSGKSKRKPPVLLMPGLWCLSTYWLIQPGTTGMPYQMADAGYDVWMGNWRGSTYGRNHTKYNPDKDDEFWDYNWNEMGKYDFTATIDYVLETTQHSKLFYSSHSMGGTLFYVGMHHNPQYNKKIIAHFGLGNVIFLKDTSGLIAFTQPPMVYIMSWILHTSGIEEIFRHEDFIAYLAELSCDGHAKRLGVCKFMLPRLCGDINFSQVNETLIPYYMSQAPGGSNVQAVEQFFQLVKQDYFRMYNYGKEGNMKYYGQPDPPNYDLSRTTATVYHYYGDADCLTNPPDVIHLQNSVPNLKPILVSVSPFAHMDFLWGIDAPKILYEDIVRRMKKILPGVP